MARKVKSRTTIGKRPLLLWVGDAVAPTGFATVTHNVLNNIRRWDSAVVGINYHGDPHGYNYPIYPAGLGGDGLGIGRVPELIEKLNPDLIVALNDPWVVKDYIPYAKRYGKPIISYTPVDAKNMRKDIMSQLNALNGMIAYTDFGKQEMRKGGLSTPTAVLPHGVDTNNFYPVGKSKARKILGIPDDWYIVGCVNRN